MYFTYNFRFKGLMTIGKQGDMSAFIQLADLKKRILSQFKIQEEDFELSMGMSADFETAVKV